MTSDNSGSSGAALGRRAIREHVFKLLFLIEFWPQDELKDAADRYLQDNPKIPEKDAADILARFSEIKEHIPEFDEIINKTAKGWKTSRMNKVDLSILRLAIYEIMYDEIVPEQVAANEAVELARKFGGEESPAFVNGILASVIKLSGNE